MPFADSAFGGYRVVRLLGKGGMAEVYEVEHPTLGIRRAMKVFRADGERAKIVYATPVSDAAATTIAKMKMIVVPSVSFKPPATLKDVLDLLRKASKEQDPRKDGVNFVLKIAEGEPVPAVPRIRAGKISVYNALDLVLESVDYDFEVKGNSVVIFKKGGKAK